MVLMGYRPFESAIERLGVLFLRVLGRAEVYEGEGDAGPEELSLYWLIRCCSTSMPAGIPTRCARSAGTYP